MDITVQRDKCQPPDKGKGLFKTTSYPRCRIRLNGCIGHTVADEGPTTYEIRSTKVLKSDLKFLKCSLKSLQPLKSLNSASKFVKSDMKYQESGLKPLLKFDQKSLKSDLKSLKSLPVMELRVQIAEIPETRPEFLEMKSKTL